MQQELKIKCPGHDNFPIIPPQLQGNFSSIERIKMTYAVNRIININDDNSPILRKRGTKRKEEITNSVRGSIYDTISANGLSTGDSKSCS